ncbi:MAG TPA: class I SAM-dependent methyltransferase [Chitinophagaceae bacterium]|nr:class I SAM-dependent methyltransferase [Chitinophagaceae bacterium]
MKCRFCETALDHVFIDLVSSPASNSYLSKEQLNEPETFYPLKVFVCDNCFLVQIDEYKKSNAIFNEEYAYFSSYSSTWLAHAKKYTDEMTQRFGLNKRSQVIEIASNDGYLLQYFKEKEIPVLGIEPTSNTARVAIQKGIDTMTDFFSSKLAAQLVKKGLLADLLLGNNVLAHVPDIIDFVKGMKLVLQPAGVITMEFPHLLQLVSQNQFDTIYHEHFSYLSFYTVEKIFAAQGLVLFDVEELPIHGGSLRIYAKHGEDTTKEIAGRVEKLRAKEEKAGIDKKSFYDGFSEKALKVKLDLISFLVEQKKAGKKIAAYGAAAKGNTLLNYCGIKNDIIEFVADANPAKQQKYLPASHIPVVEESVLKNEKPDFVIILPWNLQEEIMEQLKYIRKWDGKFVIPVPGLVIT